MPNRGISVANGMLKIIKRLIVLTVLGISGLALGLTIAFFSIVPNLPDVTELKRVDWQMPLTVYSSDGKFIAEFGENRRCPAAYQWLCHASASAKTSPTQRHQSRIGNSPLPCRVFVAFVPKAKNRAIGEALSNSLAPPSTRRRHLQEEDSATTNAVSL